MIKCLVLSKKNYLYDVLISITRFTDKIIFFNALTSDQVFDLLISDKADKVPKNNYSIVLVSRPIIISDLIQQLENFIDYKNKILSFCNINLNIITRILKYNSLQVQLTELECKLLTALIKAEFNTLSKKEIKTSIFNYDETTQTSTIESHIYHLRVKVINSNIPLSINNTGNNYKLKSLEA